MRMRDFRIQEMRRTLARLPQYAESGLATLDDTEVLRMHSRWERNQRSNATALSVAGLLALSGRRARAQVTHAHKRSK